MRPAPAGAGWVATHVSNPGLKGFKSHLIYDWFVKAWQELPLDSKNQFISRFRQLRAGRLNTEPRITRTLAAPSNTAAASRVTAATTDATNTTSNSTDTNDATPVATDVACSTTAHELPSHLLEESGRHPDSTSTTRWPDIVRQYSPRCQKGQVLKTEVVELRGSVVRRRQLSATLLFLDIAPVGEGPATAQVVLNKKLMHAAEHTFDLASKRVQVGDEMHVQGHPGFTRTGKGTDNGFSLFGTSVSVTSVQLSQKRIVAILHDQHGGVISEHEAAHLLGVQGKLVKPLTALLGSHIRKHGDENEDSRKRQRQLEDQKERGVDGDTEQERMGLTPARRERLQVLATQRHKHMYVVLENPTNPGNVAAVMRSCDAFGVTQLLIIGGGEAMRDMDNIRKRSVGASCWVQTQRFETCDACHQYLQSVGNIQLCGTTVHSERAKDLFQTNFCAESFEGLAIWFGNEAQGMTQHAQDLCPYHVFIPMKGLVESHNLSVSVAILLSEACRQREAAERGSNGT